MSYMELAAERADLMARMMVRSGVDDVEIDGWTEDFAVRQAMTACLACACVDKCRAWLVKAAPGTPAPDFCKNSELFRRLVAGTL